jgi:CRISPR-associated protein Csh2
MTDDTPTYELFENRNEIVLLYDAVNANYNGNPLSPANKPRIDESTGAGVVTDVRFKRYQLEEDGHPVYVRAAQTEDGYVSRRVDLLEDRLTEDVRKQLEEYLGGEEEPDEDIGAALLDEAVDIRMFGATLSIEGSDDDEYQRLGEVAADALPSHYEGPLQFSPAKSLNRPVQLNDSYNSLTSVIASSKEVDQGGFGLDDHRAKYALFPFYGVANENAATDTRLRAADVERLDHLCWRALKNQTITRSKVGQEPRLYLRIEYQKDSYHIGDLHHLIQLDEDESASPDQMENITDVTLNVGPLLDILNSESDVIRAVHTNVDQLVTFTTADDTVYRGTELYDHLTTAVDEESVNVVNPRSLIEQDSTE